MEERKSALCISGQKVVLEEMLAKARRAVFFGGAGVSTESGIPDFRSTDGLYNTKYKFPPEEILSHGFFMRRTAEFFDFYREKMLFPDAKPNAAHLRLAKLEREGKLFAVVTQNIDGLHFAAGSKNVAELHGSVKRNYCMKCGKFFTDADILSSKGIPRCTCGGIIKPDVVLYGENLSDETVTRAVNAICEADVMIVAGTSLAVYPAAGMVQYFRGDKLILINRDPTPLDGAANLVIHGKIGELLSEKAL